MTPNNNLYNFENDSFFGDYSAYCESNHEDTVRIENSHITNARYYLCYNALAIVLFVAITSFLALPSITIIPLSFVFGFIVSGYLKEYFNVDYPTDAFHRKLK